MAKPSAELILRLVGPVSDIRVGQDLQGDAERLRRLPTMSRMSTGCAFRKMARDINMAGTWRLTIS